MIKNHKPITLLNFRKTYSWAYSLTDRIPGFGPVDRGSIPRKPVLVCVLPKLSKINYDL